MRSMIKTTASCIVLLLSCMTVAQANDFTLINKIADNKDIKIVKMTLSCIVNEHTSGPLPGMSGASKAVVLPMIGMMKLSTPAGWVGLPFGNDKLYQLVIEFPGTTIKQVFIPPPIMQRAKYGAVTDDHIDLYDAEGNPIDFPTKF